MLQLSTAVVSASGVAPSISGVEAGAAEDLVDAVRSLAEAGSEPATRDLAAAGLRGLQSGDTARAEHFFEERLQVVAQASQPQSIGLGGFIGSLLGRLSSIATTVLSTPGSSSPPSPAGAAIDRAAAAQTRVASAQC